ncbi:MAG: hypothetical protein NWE92_13410 [Candidatus Bathyarchaeota archaeon]|nr:hypothetical protein [Candidatus Bathyarchaeota archaeon]
MPMSIVEAQTTTPFKVTQEIAPTSMPLTADSAEALKVKLGSNNNVELITAKVKPAPTPKSYALTLEIDYIDGYAPTQSVLDYMTAYYQAKNIKLTIVVDDKIECSAAYDNGISDDEFWAIERQYNDGNDNAVNANDGKYTLPEKWVLYGTTVEGSSNVVGYTLCVGTTRDLVAGNYIYIADKAADDWATAVIVSPVGAEAVVLMHEFGHSIGICVVRAGSEVYCSDYYCVMSYLRTQNAGNAGNWYYCSTHWKTVNLDYYVV